MIKILHTADIHLDSPLKSLALRDESLRDVVAAATRTAFGRIVDCALSEQVTALLIAGDLFDGKERSARTAAFLTAQMERLQSAGIRVFYIKGNHDAENPITGALDLPGNVHVFDARGGKVDLGCDVWVHGVSFSDKHAPDSLVPRFGAPVPDAVNIAMLHTSLAGAAGHDPYAPCALSDLTGAGFDYWALGHVHQRCVHAEHPWVVMPGMPQGRDIGETGEKSASLLTVEDGTITVEPVASAVVAFVSDQLSISHVIDDDSLRALLRDRLRTIAAGLTADAGVVRLTLTGAPLRHWHIMRDRDVWTELVRTMARDTGALWLDRLVLQLDAPVDSADTTSATAELAQIMTTLCDDAATIAAARAQVQDTLSDMPPSLRARLLPDDDAPALLADRLARQGALRVTALMKGSES
ncbi:DNA repair exonuclease [Loktanella sp. SALINAS62]|uniref:metallophosphoesterase family protein n=1 Tax=Loktanella sp. SALINAS62 TaxID=2706124 RepID=UPI001B8AABC9|nr:DNA repair exonuclease [Loktanella sp. SALINAS62]MBS1301145.1 DNA repair exonuclease [Loktanella sp. SALINAS62]